MRMPQTSRIAGLPDDELVSRLRCLAHGTRMLLAGFLVHLKEFDERRLHEPRGFPSLFQYCTAELRLSADEAYLRIYAARLAKAYPQVLAMLAAGEIHLSGLSKLGPRLTRENFEALLEQARGKSKRDIERLCAPLLPAPPMRDTIQFIAPARGPVPCPSPEPPLLPEPRATAGAFLSPEPVLLPGTDKGEAPENNPLIPSAAAAPPAATQRLVRFSFTAGEALLEKIERARALLRHKHPRGQLEGILTDALDALLAKKDPALRLARKRAPRDAGRDVEPRDPTRRVPQTVKDEAWQRAGGRCAYVSADQRRCGSRDFLEYDHVTPWALGGASDDPRNIRLLCRAHNGLLARERFGERPRRRRSRPPTLPK